MQVSKKHAWLRGEMVRWLNKLPRLLPGIAPPLCFDVDSHIALYLEYQDWVVLTFKTAAVLTAVDCIQVLETISSRVFY